MLALAYKTLLVWEKAILKQVKVRPEWAMSALQDCNVFKKEADSEYPDVEQYASTVCAYILKCAEDVSVTKTVITRANDKPWMTVVYKQH